MSKSEKIYVMKLRGNNHSIRRIYIIDKRNILLYKEAPHKMRGLVNKKISSTCFCYSYKHPNKVGSCKLICPCFLQVVPRVLAFH